MVGLRWGVWRPKEFPVLSRPLPPFAPPRPWGPRAAEGTQTSAREILGPGGGAEQVRGVPTRPGYSPWGCSPDSPT